MELRSIHVCFEVADFARAMAFWKPLFEAAGFAKTMSDDRTFAGYTNGSITVFIGESHPRRVVREKPTGGEFVVMDHVGFSVPRRENVDQMASAMRRAGVEAFFPAQEYPEFGPGFYAVTFLDPDNNVIEFGHRDAPASNAV